MYIAYCILCNEIVMDRENNQNIVTFADGLTLTQRLFHCLQNCA